MKIYSGESVGCGHPDKVCDIISDTVLDYVREHDKHAALAIECFLTPGRLIVGGELGTDADINRAKIRAVVVRELDKIGLNHKAAGFDCFRDAVDIEITQQSSEIRNAVFRDDKIGAGDQGIVYGYACIETPIGMPLVAYTAHKIVRMLNSSRVEFGWLYPDCKTLVTISDRYGQQKVRSVLVSAHHSAEVDLNEVRWVISELVKREVGQNVDVIVNPAGRWTVGCAAADTGLTGRKIIVDTYCGAARHGGGAFSGKDPSKVDRSGAYYARWVAKHIVKAGLATRCEIQVGYGISLSEPFNVTIDTQGSGVIPDGVIANRVSELFDFTPDNIIHQLGLLDFTDYTATACYGHFGVMQRPWEKLDDNLVGELELARHYRWIA